MIVRSSSLTVAGWRYTEERETVSSRYCCATGSVGFPRSTSARRSARFICRAFVPKNRFRPSTGRSAGTQHRPPLSRGQALSLAGRSLGQAAALKNTRGAIQQPLLPIGDLVRMDPELARQFGDRPVALYRCQRHLGLECRVVLLPCSLHVLLRATGAF